MKKALPFIFIGIALAAVIVVLIFYKPDKTFDGRITLNPTEKIPYGTYAAFNLLSKEFPKAKIEINRNAPIDWKSLSFDSSGQVLIIVNDFFNPSETDLDYLTGFAQKGNYVFISAREMNNNACKFFKVKESHSNYFDLLNDYQNISNKDTFSVTLDTAVFADYKIYSYPGVAYDNQFFRTDSTFAYNLGYAKNNEPNLLAFKAKEGEIFLHSAPITFTNFFLLYHGNNNYYEKLLSLLPDNVTKIVWDEFFLYKKEMNTESNSGSGVLSVILKYENFKWAFWIAIVLIVFFTLTEIKRKQRIIPVYSKPVNESMAFVKTVGKLYYEKADHQNLAEKLTLFFLDYVRNKYKISTVEIDDKFAHLLSVKTAIPAEEINKITNYIKMVKTSRKIKREELMNYYGILEKFYKKA